MPKIFQIAFDIDDEWHYKKIKMPELPPVGTYLHLTINKKKIAFQVATYSWDEGDNFLEIWLTVLDSPEIVLELLEKDKSWIPNS